MDKGINKAELLKLVEKIDMYMQEEISLQNQIKTVIDDLNKNLKDKNYNVINSRLSLLYDDFSASIICKKNYKKSILNVISSYENMELSVNTQIK